ncbi:MAG: hypothetical protein FD174_2774 [Geobacteraceae bacterium]|nr:MAG: hypothetical protein FD174_2774 [Geobacteraceae bacterium]
MVTEQIYTLTNQCLKEIKNAGIDHIAQLRLECLFIRLKRHIISLSLDYPTNRAAVNQKDIRKLKTLTQQITHAANKDEAVAELEKHVTTTIKALGTVVPP